MVGRSHKRTSAGDAVDRQARTAFRMEDGAEICRKFDDNQGCRKREASWPDKRRHVRVVLKQECSARPPKRVRLMSRGVAWQGRQLALASLVRWRGDGQLLQVPWRIPVHGKLLVISLFSGVSSIFVA